MTITTSNHFGGCPECGGDSGYVNDGPDHWLVCAAHATKWPVGSNLFSSWETETEEERRQAKELLKRFREVEPILPIPMTLTEARAERGRLDGILQDWKDRHGGHNKDMKLYGQFLREVLDADPRLREASNRYAELRTIDKLVAEYVRRSDVIIARGGKPPVPGLMQEVLATHHDEFITIDEGEFADLCMEGIRQAAMAHDEEAREIDRYKAERQAAERAH
jgi:hypothetical protein